MDVKEVLLTYITGGNRAGLAYDILTARRIENEKCLERYGFKVYSQNDEDGIIEEIFNRIGTTNKTFVEFGVENGLECNSHYLLHKGWRGLWLEGNEKSVAEINARFYPAIRNNQLKCLNAFITKDNINELIAEGGMVGEIDLLSVDIDGNDYYVWKAINVVKPRAVIVEYNAKFPPNHAWKQAYNAQHHWDGSDWQGASLKALELLGRELGYQLVGTNLNGVNAFFVREELAEHKFIEPARAEELYNPARYAHAYVSGHPPNVYLGDQMPNIGALNYNPQQYEAFNRTGLGGTQQFKEQARAKAQAINFEAQGMVLQLPRGHSKMFLPLVHDDFIQQSILLHEDYFDAELLWKVFYEFKGGLIAKLVGRDDSVVLDLGANIGNHTLFFANEVHAGKIISFEPVPATFDILKKNIEINGLQNKVELHKEGLADKPGRAVIAAFNEGNVGGTALKKGDGELILTTIDSLNLPKVTLMKIDVENMEHLLLAGALETIKRTRPIIMTESFPERYPLVEEFFSRLDYRHISTDATNYLFYPSELENYHDAELENYDIIISAEPTEVDRLRRGLPLIEENLGHDKIIMLCSAKTHEPFEQSGVEWIDEEALLPEVNGQPHFQEFLLMYYAVVCDKEYYLMWDANTVPIRPLYFRNRLGEMFFDSTPERNGVLVKTSIMREMINELGGQDFWRRLLNMIAADKSKAANFSAATVYFSYLHSRYPQLCRPRPLKAQANGCAIFDRPLSADELRMLPYDAITFEK